MLILKHFIFYHHVVAYTSRKSIVKFITNNVKMRHKVIQETLKIVHIYLHNNYSDLRNEFVFLDKEFTKVSALIITKIKCLYDCS